MLRHGYETLPLARALPLAGVAGGLAVVVTFALVDAVTVNIGFLGRGDGHGSGCQSACGGQRQGNAGLFRQIHRVSPLMYSFAKLAPNVVTGARERKTIDAA